MHPCSCSCYRMHPSPQKLGGVWGAMRAGVPYWDAGSPNAVIAFDSLFPLAIESKAMTLSEAYRAKAAMLAEQAKSASEPKYKERFERMALAYERLAEKYARPVRRHERRSKLRRTVKGRN